MTVRRLQLKVVGENLKGVLSDGDSQFSSTQIPSVWRFL